MGDNRQQDRILMLGLDAAGKTTIMGTLCHHNTNELKHITPTIGFNVEETVWNNIIFTSWDVGGSDKLRPLWKHYYPNTKGIIFVLDSSDNERLCSTEKFFTDYAKEELYKILNENELKNIPFLLFANKQDLANAVTINEIKNIFELHKIQSKRNAKIQGCCAITGEGLDDGLQWILNEIKST